MRHQLGMTINSFWRTLTATIKQQSEPQIWKVCDRSGNTHWHATHPATGKSISVASEEALRIWLDESYYF